MIDVQQQKIKIFFLLLVQQNCRYFDFETVKEMTLNVCILRERERVSESDRSVTTDVSFRPWSKYAVVSSSNSDI